MSRVLFVLDAPLFRPDGRMAGLQVRTYEMARALLAKGHEVSVGEPSPGSPPGDRHGIRMVGLGDIKKIQPVDVWVAHPLLVARHFRKLRHTPLVVDGYEAPFASYLAHAAALVPTHGSQVMYEYRNTVAAFLRALSLADRVLCANESQRLLYVTLLCVLGRINPSSFTNDFVLTVASGAPPDPPPSEVPETLPFKRNGPVVLWAGGCYPWFDVDTYLRAMQIVLDREPRVQFLFVGLGGRDHDGVRRPVHTLANRITDAITECPKLRASSAFVGWLPYAQRGCMYVASRLGVCTYGDHIETLFSMRTRIIDMIWGGLPVVATRGDTFSDYLERNGAGLTVPPGDSESLASAILRLLRDDALRDEMARQARRLAETSLAWDRQIEPLHDYCLNPAPDPIRSDPLVRKTAARIVRINEGLPWSVRDGWRRLRASPRNLFSHLLHETRQSTQDRL